MEISKTISRIQRELEWQDNDVLHEVISFIREKFNPQAMDLLDQHMRDAAEAEKVARTIEYAKANHALNKAELALFHKLRDQHGTRPFPLNVHTSADRSSIEELIDQKFMRSEGNMVSMRGRWVLPAYPVATAWTSRRKRT